MNNFVDDRGHSIFDIFPLDKGQINYSEIHPGAIKAFHRHKHQTDYWICIEGDILVNLVDKEKGEIKRRILSSKIPHLLEIAPGIYHGYKAIGDKPAKILYYVTNKYNPNEPDEERLGYDFFGELLWEIKNK